MRKNAKIFIENIGSLFSLFTSFLINLLAFLSRKIYRLNHLNFYSSTTSIHICVKKSPTVFTYKTSINLQLVHFSAQFLPQFFWMTFFLRFWLRHMYTPITSINNFIVMC